MAGLKHHPGFWLRDDAAAALNRAEDERGVIRINSAGRTTAQQQELINRWNRGGAANRPPRLYRPAMPATASNHVSGGGKAIDTSDFNRFNDYSEAYGFKQTFPGSDPVHFDFVGTVTLPAGGTALAFSDLVRLEQAWLNQARGEKLAVDGLKGPATREAYRRYQTFLRAYGYAGVIDGVWGPGTQAAHAKYYGQVVAPKPAPAPAPAQSGLAAVQQALKTKYPLYAGLLVVDGIDGPATRAAVKEFQRRAGLATDGIAGPRTRKALGL